MYRQNCKPTQVLFIDRANYKHLQDKHHNLDTIVSLCLVDKNITSVSKLTKDYIYTLNEKLNKALFDSSRPDSPYLDSNHHDQVYIKDSVIRFLKEDRDDYDARVELDQGSDILLPKKYYEIIPVDNNESNLLLVVLEEGFFYTLTKTKDELSSFLLDCLGYLYKSFASMRQLMKLYISLKISDGSFNLVKLRFE